MDKRMNTEDYIIRVDSIGIKFNWLMKILKDLNVDLPIIEKTRCRFLHSCARTSKDDKDCIIYHIIHKSHNELEFRSSTFLDERIVKLCRVYNRTMYEYGPVCCKLISFTLLWNMYEEDEAVRRINTINRYIYDMQNNMNKLECFSIEQSGALKI